MTANHSSWPHIAGFNFDNIYQSWQGYQIKNKGLAGLYIRLAIKRYYLEKHTSISEKCQAHKKVSEARQFGTIATLALNWHNIWLREHCLFGVIACSECNISNTETYLKLCEGEANLVAHSAQAICSRLRFYEPYMSCNYTLSPLLFQVLSLRYLHYQRVPTSNTW